MTTKFLVPEKIQRRLPAPALAKSKSVPVMQQADEIIPIADWPAYRAAHPELVFTEKFDRFGNAIFSERIETE